MSCQVDVVCILSSTVRMEVAKEAANWVNCMVFDGCLLLAYFAIILDSSPVGCESCTKSLL